MTRPRCESFWDYREWFRERLQAERRHQASESGATYDKSPDVPTTPQLAPLDERLIQTIWAQQLIQTTGLRTRNGQTLGVLDPGRWNGSGGPDFKDASLMIEERLVRGDVEIHVDAADWTAHGHQRDLDYNTVVLHVALRCRDERHGDPLHNGGEVPRLEIEPYLFPDLDTLRRSLSPDDYLYAESADLGRCHRLMSALEAETLTDFLDRAGRERLIAKMQRLDEQAGQVGAESAAEPLEQVFYQAVMMGLGTGPGKTLYYLLAKRTPLAQMFDYVGDLPESQWALGLESLLLHVAGLAPDDASLAKADDEARQHGERLREVWPRFAPDWRDRGIPPTKRWRQGARPTNFPTRRLVGVAVLLARAMRTGKRPLADLVERIRLGRSSLEGAVPKRRKHPLLVELADWFRVRGAGRFWGTHYSFTARPSARTLDLIGQSAALSLVVNAVLPAALLTARREDDPQLARAVETLYSLVPPLQSNHITQFMARRLFGEGGVSAAPLTTEQRRQALFQIFYHCCHQQERNCDRCYYFQGDAEGGLPAGKP